MIWCVEDDSGIREIEVYTLNSTGFEARGFSDGASFREALETETPDLVLLDVMLPGEDGVSLLRYLRQTQRLCIARALAVEPQVLLMDEPTSALDPISTSRIEELAIELKDRYTIVIVTHNMQQAARISDRTAFFLLGELVECGDTEQIFAQPRDKRTEDYITGRFG